MNKMFYLVVMVVANQNYAMLNDQSNIRHSVHKHIPSLWSYASKQIPLNLPCEGQHYESNTIQEAVVFKNSIKNQSIHNADLFWQKNLPNPPLIKKLINQDQVLLEDASIIKDKSTIESLLWHMSNKDEELLMIASTMGFTDYVKKQIILGANIHAFNDASIRNAAENGHVETVELLLNFGADPSALYHLSLFRAIKNRHFDVVKILIDHAEVHLDSEPVPQWIIESSLSAAAEKNNTAILTILLQSSCYHAEDKNKYPEPRILNDCLHKFIQNNNTEAAQLLLENGAHILAAPLNWPETSNKEMFELLEKYSKSYENMTPEEYEKTYSIQILEN